MGRAPCCDKANVKKGPWSPEEDAKLKSYIEQHGTGGNWIALPQKIGLKRCGKSCRLRWLNYLRPNLKHGGFSEEEDNIICSLYISIGSRWSVIAAQLPGRTDNDIKNYWNTKLKKKLLGKHRKEQQQQRQQHARNKGIKQEIINRSNGDQYSSSLVLEGNNTSTQQPCWPQINMPVFQQLNQTGPSFNDQDAIKKLLIKLGGRFSDDYYHEPVIDGLNHLQFPDGTLPSAQQIIHHQEQVHIGSSSGGCNMNSDNNNNNNQVVQGSFLGEGSFLEMLGEMESIEHYQQQRLSAGGMEFIYGEEDHLNMIINNGKILGSSSNCSQTTNWGETTSSTLINPSPPDLVASNYQEPPPPPPQECVFQELSYLGAAQ